MQGHSKFHPQTYQPISHKMQSHPILWCELCEWDLESDICRGLRFYILFIDHVVGDKDSIQTLPPSNHLEQSNPFWIQSLPRHLNSWISLQPQKGLQQVKGKQLNEQGLRLSCFL